MELLEVRVSSLTSYTSCPKRSFANYMHADLQKRFGLRPRKSGVGAAIGTTLHAVVAELMRTKLIQGELFAKDIELALEKVWPSFLKEAGDDCVWDKTTPREYTAREQLRAMAAGFLPALHYISPFKIEQEYKFKISPLGDQAIPILLTGHLDLLDTRYVIHDWKTGKSFPAPHLQMGGYAILLALCEEINAKGIRINFVPRLGITKVDEIPAGYQSESFDVEVCKRAAWTTLKEIQRHYMQWLESGGDPDEIPADNTTYLCTPNHCSAIGTPFCKIGKSCGEGDE